MRMILLPTLFLNGSHFQASPSTTNKRGPELESQKLLTLADNTDKQPFTLVQVLDDLWSNYTLELGLQEVFPFW